MPLIPNTTLKSDEPVNVTFTALDGSTDAFGYTGQAAYLVFQNSDASPATVVLLGDQATTVKRDGITDIDVSGGKSVTVPAAAGGVNGFTKVYLPAAAAYLKDSTNQPNITGGASTLSALLLVQ